MGVGVWGAKENRNWTESQQTDDVLKWEKMSGKGVGLGERKGRICVMEEGRSVVGAAHLTPPSHMDPVQQ